MSNRLKTNLKTVEATKVVDTSKLNDYLTCPRKYFFRHLLGWREEGHGKTFHLDFGTCVHAAMDVLMNSRKHPTRPGYEPAMELIMQASEAFTIKAMEVNPELLSSSAAKNFDNLQRALIRYVKDYSRDEFIVHYNEVAGTVRINSSDDCFSKLYFKQDSICEDSRGIFSLERKTGSKLTAEWQEQWMTALQMGTYIHVLHHLFPDKPIYGLIVDGILFSKKSDAELCRVVIKKDLPMLQAWLDTVNCWMEQLAEDYDILQNELDAGDRLSAFPMRPVSCTMYGRACEYLPFCASRANPLADCEEPPIGMMVEFWDPREHSEQVEKKIEVEKEN
jgi:CRISPR/Cas system-associated exonuclease Cas4 (RecB family)